MRKLVFLPLFLLLAACGSAAVTEVTAVPEEAGDQAAAGTQTEAVEQEAPAANPSSGGKTVTIGTTPQEAGQVREQDYVKGADDPVVTVIEYGDFQ